MADQDLYGAAVQLRDACRSILAEDAPERCYVCAGTPADDTTDYLAVWADPINLVDPATDTAWGVGEMQRMASIPRTTMNIRIMRKAAAPAQRGRPRLQDIEVASATTYRDAWRLLNGIRRRINAETLLAGLTAAALGAVSATTESGLSVGWQLIVEVSLEGYDPEAAS